MSGVDWEVIVLGPAVAIGALVVFTAAASRRRRRRKSARAQLATRSRSQVRERRIEVVAIDEGVGSSPEQKPNA
jgi:membrane protein implicated in regulation of membrane protease activity